MKEPREYSNDKLITLCERCHEVNTFFCKHLAGLASNLNAVRQIAVLGFLDGMASRLKEGTPALSGHPIYLLSFEGGKRIFGELEIIKSQYQDPVQ